MSEMTDKAKGLANQAAGKIKQGVGEATGSDRLQAEGAAQNVKGQAQKAMGDPKGAVKGAASRAADAADEALNRR